MGPLYGSLMTEFTNFRYTCDFVALLCLLFSFLYFISTDGVSAFKNSSCKDDTGVPMEIGHSFIFQPQLRKVDKKAAVYNNTSMNHSYYALG